MAFKRRLNIIGKIVSGGGDDENYILIIYDPKRTGGYYIFTSENSTFDTGYDLWVENIHYLDINIIEYNIEWKYNIVLPAMVHKF